MTLTNAFGALALESGGNLATILGRLPANLTVTSTRLLVDGSGVTQPVSGSVTANAGTNLNTSALALESGNLATILGRLPANLTVSSTRLLVDGSGVTQPVSGPLTDTQLRASAVLVTANAGTNLNTSALALESGGNLAGIRTDLGTDGTSPPTLPGGSTGVRGWLRYMASLWPTLVGGLWPVVLPNKTVVTGSAGLSAINTNLLTGGTSDWSDAQGYSSVIVNVVQSVGISSGAFIFEGSPDQTAVFNLQYQGTATTTQSLLSGAVTASANSTSGHFIQLPYRYWRVRISTAIVGGTVQGIATYSNSPQLPGLMQVLNPSGVNISANLAQVGTNAVQSRGGAITNNPLVVGLRGATAAPTAVTNGQAVDPLATVQGHVITRPWQIPELCWSYAAASGGITNTTDVAIAAAAGAGLRRYCTGVQLSNNSATATEVVIKDGASTVLKRIHCPANMVTANITFEPPISTTANAAMNVACITTAAAVYVNAQGFTAP